MAKKITVGSKKAKVKVQNELQRRIALAMKNPAYAARVKILNEEF